MSPHAHRIVNAQVYAPRPPSGAVAVARFLPPRQDEGKAEDATEIPLDLAA